MSNMGGMFRKQPRAEISDRWKLDLIPVDVAKKNKALQISIFKKIVNPICPMELEYLPTHLS